MSTTATSIDDLLIEKLRTRLKAEGYSRRVQRWYPARARHLLDYCGRKALAIDGVRSQSKLPYLATYLGHKDIRSTLVYLNITPELLQEAGERFRKNGAAALRGAEDPR